MSEHFIPNIYDDYIGNDKEHHPTLNQLGHRCDDITSVLGTDLGFKKYFIVLGDNAGLHMHKPVEETWPYLYAKESNNNYYNLCVINGGLEAVKFNLFAWLKNHPNNLPKKIFISCEWANRFFHVDYDSPDHDINRASHLGDGAGYFLGRQKMFSLLVDLLDIPIYQIMRSTDVPVLVSDKIKNIIVDVDDDETVTEALLGDLRESLRATSV
tara:strand:+ start:589 stop:1224 length:636 start_codon:yes stop_codon:yes gene_type:complete